MELASHGPNACAGLMASSSDGSGARYRDPPGAVPRQRYPTKHC